MRRDLRSLRPSGLRGRLLLALVATAAITLGATAAVVLGPLREKLRSQSVHNLESAVVVASRDFEARLVRDEPQVSYAARQSQTAQEFDRMLSIAVLRTPVAANALNERTGGARVIVAGLVPVTLGPVYDTDNAEPTRAITLASLNAERTGRTMRSVDGDDVTIAMPLFGQHGVIGSLVVAKQLTEVTTAVEQVRNALLAAALVGLAVAIALAIALSRTLTLRLGRLRAAALRISTEGPDASAPPRDRARDEVGDLARALARMQDELRRQETARRSFVATASHELRTPLTMLQGTMELLEEDLREGGDLTDAQDQVASARHELLRLSALAGELLDLSRLDAEVQLRSEAVEIGELARAVAAEFELRARERDVALEVVPPAGPLWARGDPDAIARVVRILLDNAMRYAPAGAPVRLRGYEDGGAVALEVLDRGPGVPDEEREHIFERFHRGRSAGSASGFGLGLAIGRELAERMNGRLELNDPSAASGAAFVLRLPTASVPGDGSPPTQRRVLT